MRCLFDVFFGWGCCNAVASRRHLLSESRECCPAPGGAAMPRALELRCFCCSSAFKSKFNGIASLSQSITRPSFKLSFSLPHVLAGMQPATEQRHVLIASGIVPLILPYPLPLTIYIPSANTTPSVAVLLLRYPSFQRQCKGTRGWFNLS